MFKTIIAIVLTTVVVLIIMAVVDKTTSKIVSSTPVSSQASTADTLQVTVTGEVNHTGTYLLKLESTLQDLLDSAGGTTSNADPKAYDVSVVLANKDSFFIAPIYDNGNTCAVTPITKVCINSADKTALMSISAFSSSVAANIVTYREEKGNFKRIEELKNVNGIGNATFEKCKNFVTLTD
jgi:competence protein ComEA helix-hairpin-helix repeat region